MDWRRTSWGGTYRFDVIVHDDHDDGHGVIDHGQGTVFQFTG